MLRLVTYIALLMQADTGQVVKGSLWECIHTRSVGSDA